MSSLKQSENNYIYYQSLYWKQYNYISVKNTDALIANNSERVTQIISKVVQQISNATGSIPIVGTVNSGIDIDEEIQLAIIKQSKRLSGQEQDSQLGLQQHIKQIQDAVLGSGNQQAQNPYWKQGIVDTLKVLRNLLLFYESIQSDHKKELHAVILEALQEDDLQIHTHQVVKPGSNWCDRCSNNCQIQ